MGCTRGHIDLWGILLVVEQCNMQLHLYCEECGTVGEATLNAILVLLTLPCFCESSKNVIADYYLSGHDS